MILPRYKEELSLWFSIQTLNMQISRYIFTRKAVKDVSEGGRLKIHENGLLNFNSMKLRKVYNQSGEAICIPILVCKLTARGLTGIFGMAAASLFTK